jgi:hypothetical protein
MVDRIFRFHHRVPALDKVGIHLIDQISMVVALIHRLVDEWTIAVLDDIPMPKVGIGSKEGLHIRVLSREL